MYPVLQDVRLTGITESVTRRKRQVQLSALNTPRCQWATSTTPTPAVKPKTVRLPPHPTTYHLTHPFCYRHQPTPPITLTLPRTRRPLPNPHPQRRLLRHHPRRRPRRREKETRRHPRGARCTSTRDPGAAYECERAGCGRTCAVGYAWWTGGGLWWVGCTGAGEWERGACCGVGSGRWGEGCAVLSFTVSFFSRLAPFVH